MTHPLVYAVTIGIAACAALYAIFGRQRQDSYSYSNSKSNDTYFRVDNSNNCTICLSEIKAEKERRYLDCGHCFHIKCITQWFQIDNVCPNCRERSRR